MEIRQGEQQQENKRPYNIPRLLRYGTFLDITEGTGGPMREPGGASSPKSRSNGTTL